MTRSRFVCWVTAAFLVAMLPPSAFGQAEDVARNLLKGVRAFEKKDYDGAIGFFDEALRLEPKNADAYYRRGEAYRGKRNFDKAIADYTQAIQLAPKNADA